MWFDVISSKWPWKKLGSNCRLLKSACLLGSSLWRGVISCGIPGESVHTSIHPSDHSLPAYRRLQSTSHELLLANYSQPASLGLLPLGCQPTSGSISYRSPELSAKLSELQPDIEMLQPGSGASSKHLGIQKDYRKLLEEISQSMGIAARPYLVQACL